MNGKASAPVLNVNPLSAIAPGIFGTPMLRALPQEAQDSLGASVPFPKRLGEPREFADLVLTIVRSKMTGELMTARLDRGPLNSEFEDVHTLIYHLGTLYNETTMAEVRSRANAG